jgi:hypothetical protein
MGEVAIVAVIFGGPLLIRTIFTIIPVVVILVVPVVVPLLVFVVPIPMFVILMVIVLKIGACQHSRRRDQSRAQQK